MHQIKQKARSAMGGSSQAGDMSETTGQGNMGQGFDQGFDQNQGNLGRGFDNTGMLLVAVS